jgi:hypothetical protein
MARALRAHQDAPIDDNGARFLETYSGGRAGEIGTDRVMSFPVNAVSGNLSKDLGIGPSNLVNIVTGGGWSLAGGSIYRRWGREEDVGRRNSRDSLSAGGRRWWPVGPVSPLRSQVPCLPVLPHTIQLHRPRAACGRRPRCGGRGMRARCTRPGLTAMPASERSGRQARQGGRCPPRWPAGREGRALASPR